MHCAIRYPLAGHWDNTRWCWGISYGLNYVYYTIEEKFITTAHLCSSFLDLRLAIVPVVGTDRVVRRREQVQALDSEVFLLGDCGVDLGEDVECVGRLDLFGVVKGCVVSAGLLDSRHWQLRPLENSAIRQQLSKQFRSIHKYLPTNIVPRTRVLRRQEDIV